VHAQLGVFDILPAPGLPGNHDLDTAPTTLELIEIAPGVVRHQRPKSGAEQHVLPLLCERRAFAPLPLRC
jgi:hypothetical protein